MKIFCTSASCNLVPFYRQFRSLYVYFFALATTYVALQVADAQAAPAELQVLVLVTAWRVALAELQATSPCFSAACCTVGGWCCCAEGDSCGCTEGGCCPCVIGFSTSSGLGGD